MFSYKLAYRFIALDTGAEVLEGFTGVSLTKKSAYDDAIRKVKIKCDTLGEAFNEARLVLTGVGLTNEQIKGLEDDWRTSAGSNFC